MKKARLLSLALALVLGLSGLPVASAATSPYVESDTTVSFSRPQNETYQVKFTVHGSQADPKITAGNGSVLKTQNVTKSEDKSGNVVYYFKVKATGDVGATSAIYTTLPGQSAVRHFILTVGKPIEKVSNPTTSTSTSIKLIQGAGTVGRGYSASLSIKGKPNTDYTLTVYYPSGPSKAAGVGTTKSDSNGNASWSWKVGTRTTAGSHSITITGGGQTLETSFSTK